MPKRLETTHPEVPGSEGVMCDEAEVGRAGHRVSASHTKGCVLSAEGRRKPLQNLEQDSGMICVLEGLLGWYVEPGLEM